MRDGERPMTELMAHFGYKKRESLKKAILGELLSKGMIEMTHPENHNHRSQRYRLTDAGRKEIE